MTWRDGGDKRDGQTAFARAVKLPPEDKPQGGCAGCQFWFPTAPLQGACAATSAQLVRPAGYSCDKFMPRTGRK